jgi:DNA repair exonuclease SbcCD ATPase subunit
MSQLHTRANDFAPGHDRAATATADANGDVPSADELMAKLLQEENDALRSKVEELSQLVAKADQIAEERWADLQHEYETLIEEKSETIRCLHHKYTELRGRGGSPGAGGDSGAPVPVAPDPQEAVRVQREIQDQRRQMEEDEESMMGQMRQMEMALAKDRAELARQRAELQRLHQELKHELEVAARDGGLRERLGALQRSVNNATSLRTSVNRDTPPPVALPKPPLGPTTSPPKSGLFRRIFGPSR